ncbi:keto-hydroxyglutarate-aldolase/keto-deoxy-phosphogluconate aldolase [Caloramator mitchellensis]|uniref:Keto-hydroxyglutarate-aldolase/keto-deoxy-phosphogluconate aldolase n=1 Tax=Caloramator mitchellensis TaxID=908809 RepID=A0A0R3JVW5_CALMK|nr:hypothetical protein [Caloramator mitchellensis]KRQ87210.1 keto-hydroxyglutarate-aldolase/keto-deoxy-phosphogluconate aldolase [Caloramator mitchellensis]
MPTDKYIPEIKGNLRNHLIEVPNVIREASGIIIFGRRIKSLVFSTDVAIIRNTNADAVIAVYPFTPQPVIAEAILNVSEVPVFCGVGGGLTTGKRVIRLSRHVEFLGAIGVVVNAPTPNETIKAMRDEIDIPIVVTVVSEKEDFKARIDAGASIFNVSGAANTVKIIKRIREEFPFVPIIATGGPSEDTIRETIKAGANAITYTPPTTGDIFRKIMDKYRDTF